MNCTTVKKESSAYIDGQLQLAKSRRLEAHLTTCARCADHIKELRFISQGLGQLPPPRVPARLLSDTLEAFDTLNRRRNIFGDAIRRLTKIAFFHPRAVSSVASLVITTSLFVAVLSNFKPLPEMEFEYHREPITLSTVQFNLLNQGALPAPGAGVYTIPRVQHSSGLDAFLDVTKSSQVVLITQVQSDGRASVVDVVGSSARSSISDAFRESFQGLRFHPATSSGRPVATQLVLLIQKLDVE